MDHFIAPNVLGLHGALRVAVGAFEVLPIMRFISGAGAALVGAIVLAFSVVYDARLYLTLSKETNPQTNLWQMTEGKQAYSSMCKSGGSLE